MAVFKLFDNALPPSGLKTIGLHAAVSFFLERMKSVKEADGRPLLDHCALGYSSGMGIGHSKSRLPTAMFGGRAMGIDHQGHLKLEENTPLSAVWHTMLDRLDVPVGESFQDSPGVIKPLLA